jgi:tetratricopeptide (TPR) repeat protein
MTNKLFYFALLFYINTQCFAQNRVIDSLNALLKTEANEKKKISLYTELSNAYEFINSDTAIILAKEGLKLSEAIKQDHSTAKFQSDLATFYMSVSNYKAALSYFNLAIKKYEELLENPSWKPEERQIFKAGISGALSNTGNLYSHQGNYPLALSFYFKALKINEEIDHKQFMAANLSNIGVMYNKLQDLEKALVYFNRALEIDKLRGNKTGMAIRLSNIGGIYKDKKEPEKAMEYYLKALEIDQSQNDIYGIALGYTNIGTMYSEMGDKINALAYFEKSLKLAKEMKDRGMETLNLLNMGWIHLLNKKYVVAEKYLVEGVKTAMEINAQEEIRAGSEKLSELYRLMGHHEEALIYYKLSIRTRDSLFNQENTKKSIQSEMQFEYEKKVVADSLKAAEEKRVSALELKQERTQKYALYGGLSLVGVFAIFMYNRFRITSRQKKIIEQKEQETQKQNEIISLQKHEVEEKQKEILDSIKYAHRIQRALITNEKYIEKNLTRVMEKRS